jgi:hypothetical protein
MISPEMCELSNGQPLQIMTFQRLCQGDRQSTTNVSIVHRDSMPDGPGNVLVVVDSAGSDDPARFPYAVGTFDGSATVTVTYDPAARVIKRDTVVRGFNVRYRFTDSLLKRSR